MPKIVYTVENGTILEVYEQRGHAEIHSRTVTGSRVVERVVRDTLADTVLDDISSDDWSEAETPVARPNRDMVDTHASSPRAKAKGKPRK